MKKKIRVGIICGGRSVEHEISLLSAKNVIEALDREKYEPVLFSISKNGQWALHHSPEELFLSSDVSQLTLSAGQTQIAVVPDNHDAHTLIALDQKNTPHSIDVMLPILHGTYGEDGTIQGLLKLVNIPFVGADVLGSAVGMDKDVMKRLLREAGIPNARSLTIRRHELSQFSFSEIEKHLGLPFFIKPANAGSSVGVAKIKTNAEFQEKLLAAFQYDHKVICEEAIDGREIECAILGNENPIASLPAEVKSSHEFYSYQAKYLDVKGATFEVPAQLSSELIQKVQALAIRVFQVLECEGMARVDFFLTQDEKLYVNEINTIPGFTKISMYPRMWEVSGISYPELLDKLIELALARFARNAVLKTNFHD